MPYFPVHSFLGKKKVQSLELMNISLIIWCRSWNNHKQYNRINFLFLFYLSWLVCSQLSKNTLSRIEKEPGIHDIHSQLTLVEIRFSIADECVGHTQCTNLANWLPEIWADQRILSGHSHCFISLFPISLHVVSSNS